MVELEVISSFFSKEAALSTQFLDLIDDLNDSLEEFQHPSKVKCVYNSTIYARHTFEMFTRQYCNTKKQIMYLGINPGPFGMTQTGVPFGEIKSVKDWLNIEGPVGKPPNELKCRPVKGFNCTRTEVSGQRFWGLFKELCGTPDKFFNTSFVYNYLPQQWMEANGNNLTPSNFKVNEMKPLFKICDPIIIKVLELYEVKTIVTIGKFCETRAKQALKQYIPERNIQLLYLTHPSPRVPNNQNWNEYAKKFLKENDLLRHYTN